MAKRIDVRTTNESEAFELRQVLSQSLSREKRCQPASRCDLVTVGNKAGYHATFAGRYGAAETGKV